MFLSRDKCIRIIQMSRSTKHSLVIVGDHFDGIFFSRNSGMFFRVQKYPDIWVSRLTAKRVCIDSETMSEF